MTSFSAAIKLKILKTEYPGLNLASDPEIERYFELRKMGRIREAFAIYNSYLRTRYTDEAERVALLKAYRCRDPLYGQLLLKNVLRQADQVTEKILNIITALTDDISRLNLSDAYSVIKGLDRIIAALSGGGDKYQSLATANKMVNYSKLLSYRTPEMQQTAELLRLYVTDNIASITQFRQEKERERKNAARSQPRGRPTQIFDFSAVEFSTADMVRIRIAPSLTRIEDKVIAYCIKYWNLIADAVFEKTVYLYSKKYNSVHYSVFMAIKNGRVNGHKDEEILNSVLSVISSGYYYNIRGDLYLQAMWKRMKEKFVTPAARSVPVSSLPLAVKKESAKKLAPSPTVKPSPDPASRAEAVKKTPQPVRVVPNTRVRKAVAVKTAPDAAAPAIPVAAPAIPVAAPAIPVAAPAIPAAPPAVPAAAPPPQKPRRQPARASRAASSAPVKAPVAASEPAASESYSSALPGRPVSAAPSVKQPAAAAPARSARMVKPVSEAAVVQTEPESPTKPRERLSEPEQIRARTGSISDSIKKLSSLSYDLYKDLFFAQVRPAIRSILGKSRTRKMLFESNQNQAEEAVFSFLQDNYDNPYMDWENSSQKKTLDELGYSVISVLPIVTLWYKNR